MKLLLTTLTLFSALTSFAEPNDVKPVQMTKGSLYVRVSKIDGNRVRFEKCTFGYEDSTCEILGRKQSYSIKELKKQRTKENYQIAGSVLADLGIIVGTVLTGGAAGAGYAVAFPGVFGTVELTGGILMGGLGGLATVPLTGAIAAVTLDGLDPIEQYDQATTLNSDVLNDEDVSVKNIESYIQRLNLVLSKID